MASASEHAKLVLAAIIPDRRDLLDLALLRLSSDHFIDPVWKSVFVMLDKYFQATHGILTKSAVSDILRNSGVTDAGRVLDFEEKFDLLLETDVAEDSFKWSVEQLKELAAERATEKALTDAMMIKNHGLQLKKSEDPIRGHQAARDFIQDKLLEINHSLKVEETPEGDIRKEKQDILEEYFTKKEMRCAGTAPGIFFGINDIDSRVGGVQPGELCLIAGYSSVGKSSVCAQMAWWASVMQGKNVVYVTGETGKETTRHRIISRHSKLSQFNLPEGLNNKWLKEGTIPEESEGKFLEIVDDFTSNSDYGICNVLMLPRAASIATLEAKLVRLQDDYQIDLVICDSLNLLNPLRKRSSRTEESAETMKEAQNIVTTFNYGKGLPLVSPWQVNRAGKERADQQQFYVTTALAETAESTNSADLIVAFLETPGQVGRYVQLGGAIIKNRDGEKSANTEISVDYGTSFFQDAQGSTLGISSSNSFSSDLDSLLL